MVFVVDAAYGIGGVDGHAADGVDYVVRVAAAANVRRRGWKYAH
ncbi:MAG TPA: hypothetical protein VNT81_08320 [Vicinamibacterales bacterium]|nr:hypothetical protein [Vicinamibacterales bacterium]